ncbi:MAG: hypothetical protein C5S52_01800 [ANME-2 cluster archaeon]|nr:hypothetical protein [ANME-2 cluster archaeon]
MIAGHGASPKISPAKGNFTIMAPGLTPIFMIDEKFYTM